MKISIPRQICAVTVLNCSILLSGCVPLMGHYYGPSTPGGTVSQHDCNGRAGEMTNVEFERGDVKILVISDFGSASSRTLSVQLRLHTEDRVLVRWNELEAIDNAGNRIQTEIKGIYGYSTAVRMNHFTKIDSDSSNNISGQNFNLYDVEAQIKGDLPDEFIVVIPSMIVNGIKYATTKITFTKRIGMWLQFFNC